MKTKTQPAQVVPMNNKVTVKDLHSEMNVMKYSNDLQHTQLSERIDTIQSQMQENKTWFNLRLDKLDNRIWAIVMLTLGSLLASILSMLVV